MNAIETIKTLITSKVNLLNLLTENVNYSDEAYDRIFSELRGMMICLKNIDNGDRFYNLNWKGNKIEFGYYNENHEWVSIA